MCTRLPWTSRYNHNWCSIITLLNTGHVCVSALNFEREKQSSWRPIRLFKLWQGRAEAVFYGSLISRLATLRTQTKETRVHVVRRSLNISVQSFEDVPLRVHTETRNMRHVWLFPPKNISMMKKHDSQRRALISYISWTDSQSWRSNHSHLSSASLFTVWLVRETVGSDLWMH